jgi:hypothetical protein
MVTHQPRKLASNFIALNDGYTIYNFRCVDVDLLFGEVYLKHITTGAWFQCEW